MSVEFAFELTITALMAFAYAAVAHAIGRRDVGTHARNANQAYVAFWASLSLLTALQLGNLLLTAFDAWTLPGYMAYLHGAMLLLMFALTGLLYYLVFLFTGRRWTWAPLAVFYVLFWLVLVYAIHWGGPVGLQVESRSTELVYERELEEIPWVQALGLALLIPPIVGALAYASLFFKAPGRLQRFRIATVAGSIAVWFFISLVASVSGMGETSWWLVASRAIALAAAGANLVAYRPPAWLIERLERASGSDPAAAI